MSKYAVVYYSSKGSNKFLANKTAKALGCDLIRLKPRLDSFFFLLLASATKISPGNKSIKYNFSECDSIVLCGPIWMGQFIAPLHDFLKKYIKDIKMLNFITCCGSTDSTKDDKFGYATVFLKIRSIMGEKCRISEAFPIELVLPENKRSDDQAMMNTRLSDSNFKGKIQIRFDDFINKLRMF